jgi:hypothetical protein
MRLLLEESEKFTLEILLSRSSRPFFVTSGLLAASKFVAHFSAARVRRTSS